MESFASEQELDAYTTACEWDMAAISVTERANYRVEPMDQSAIL